MRKIHTIILCSCLALAAATAYAKSTGKGQDAEALGLMSKGDNWLGTNVFKRLVAKHDTPLNRFNLATGYQRTGRLEQARSIYRDLLTQGRNVNVMQTPTDGAPGVRFFNLADEAASRLKYFDWLKSESARRQVAQASTPASASADAYGVPASVTVGGSTYGDVSDEAAMALDSQARQDPAP